MTPPLLGTASKLLPRMVDELLHCTRGSYDVKSQGQPTGRGAGGPPNTT